MNVDSQYSEELKKKHFDFLHCVYKAPDLNKFLTEISLGYIAKSINLSKSEVRSISEYLSTQDFIKIDDLSFFRDEIDDYVSITSKGIAEVKKQVTQNLSDSIERLLRSTNVENVDIAVRRQKIKHYLVLDSIYKATEYNTDKDISLGYITKDIGLSDNEVISIAKYLVSKGFLSCMFELNSITDAVSITFEGIAEAEDIASTNKPKTLVAQTSTVSPHPPFINEDRLQEIRDLSLKQSKFDYRRLIKLCEELNSSYSNGNYYATAMLTRAIMDHVPPIFNCGNFQEVANNYATDNRSFKGAMDKLNIQRHISDSFLHQKIRKSETLPDAEEVNTSPPINHLLREIVRILNNPES